jgi:hypothetical protein
MGHVLRTSERAHRVVECTPYGPDERQSCSLGFNLGVAALPGPHTAATALPVPERNRSYANRSRIASRSSAGAGCVTHSGVEVTQNGPDRDVVDVELLGRQTQPSRHRREVGLPFNAVADTADGLREAQLIKE